MTTKTLQNKSDNQTAALDMQHCDAIERTSTRPVFSPAVDIYEKADSLVVVADMPGVDEKTIDINVENRVLTIRGKAAAPEREGYQLAYSEYKAGDYERSFTLSSEVAINHIEASVKQGVLEIVLPKSEEAKPKKITVKAGYGPPSRLRPLHAVTG